MINKQASPEDEIDLIQVAGTIWKGRKKIMLLLLGFGFLGLIISWLTPAEYTAKTIVVTRTESRSSASGNLGGLAAMVGINLGTSVNGGNELVPGDYPDFVKSLSFQKVLIHTPISWQRFPQPVTLADYYQKYYKPGALSVIRQYTIGLPGVITGWFSGSSNIGTSQQSASRSADEITGLLPSEQAARGMLTRKLKLTLNPNNNFITIEARAPEAKVAVQLAQKARALLQEKVTELKISKAKDNLAFTTSLYQEKKKDFFEAQSRLAHYRDRNANLGSETARTEEEQLRSEYDIAFTVYEEMAKQLENAKIQVKEDTPIFSVIEEATLPNMKSSPKTGRNFLIWLFLGGVVGVAWVLTERVLAEARKRWAENL